MYCVGYRNYYIYYSSSSISLIMALIIATGQQYAHARIASAHVYPYWHRELCCLLEELLEFIDLASTKQDSNIHQHLH